jgi:hypothetical protein
LVDPAATLVHCRPLRLTAPGLPFEHSLTGRSSALAWEYGTPAGPNASSGPKSVPGSGLLAVDDLSRVERDHGSGHRGGNGTEQQHDPPRYLVRVGHPAERRPPRPVAAVLAFAKGPGFGEAVRQDLSEATR